MQQTHLVFRCIQTIHRGIPLIVFPAKAGAIQFPNLALSLSCPSFPRKREPRDFSHLLLGPRFRGDDELALPDNS
jgi:hypothetical protein